MSYEEEYGYLVHSKGPWKKHKYMSKIGNKYVYAKNQATNGIRGFGAKLRKKVGLDARDEFNRRARAEEPSIVEYNSAYKHRYQDGKNGVAYRAYKGAEYKHRELHKQTVNAYDKYKRTLVGRAETALNKVRYKDNDYASGRYWEPAKRTLTGKSKSNHKVTITSNAMSGKGFKKNSALTEAGNILNEENRKRKKAKKKK